MPTDDPTHIAKEVTPQSLLNWFVPKAWSYSETRSFGRECDAVFPSQRGEHSRERLRLILNTDRRRFHTIRAEGAERIPGEFKLDLYSMVADGELGGDVRHWPPLDNGKDGDDLLGTVRIAEPMMRQLIDGLRSGKRVAVGIQMPIFKEAISHSFDEDWMSQDLYMPYNERVLIDQISIDVTEEQGELNEPASFVDAHLPLETEPVPIVTEGSNAELFKRMNWVLALLALIAILLAIQ